MEKRERKGGERVSNDFEMAKRAICGHNRRSITDREHIIERKVDPRVKANQIRLSSRVHTLLAQTLISRSCSVPALILRSVASHQHLRYIPARTSQVSTNAKRPEGELFETYSRFPPEQQ